MNVKYLKHKLLILLLTLSFVIFPVPVLSYSNKVIVGGENIGIEVNAKGILVVGFYNVGKSSPGKQAGLKVGDIIIKIDDTAIDRIADLSTLSNDKSTLIITYLRDNVTYNTNLNLIKDNNEVYKTGIYVKDSIIGIGTLTFIDPDTLSFGALGHEITERSTGKKFEIENGKIFKSMITGIEKSSKNDPGEKNAKYYTSEIYGTIEKNEISGIYGSYNANIDKSKILDVGEPNEVKLGAATIKTVINGDKVEEFEINIIKIFIGDTTKNILFEVTDKKLLNNTNGIVQGMSGSPIIQNNKIVGAVTHVVVDDPTKGYGIFITNMLKEADKMKND